MAQIISKGLSLLVVAIYGLAYVVSTGKLNIGLVYLAGYVCIPLALIWFPEIIGGMTGNIGQGGNIDLETPPALVGFFGWLFLLGAPLLTYFLG